MTKTMALLLLLACGVPAQASSLSVAAARAGRRAAQETTDSATNRYRWPAGIMIAGGATTAVVGFLARPIGRKVVTHDAARTTTIVARTAEDKYNTLLGYIGLGVAGGGAALLVYGELRNPVADLSAGFGRVALTRTVRF